MDQILLNFNGTLIICNAVKEIFDLEMSSLTCPQVPNLYEFFFSSVEHKRRYFKKLW